MGGGPPIGEGARSAPEHMGEGRRDRTRGPSDYEYSASISLSYLRSIGRRFSFIVGVSSSPPGGHSPSSSLKRLICSTRERRSLAASTAAAISVAMAGSSAQRPR